MGESTAGKWVIGIIVYFFLFFLVTTSVVSLRSWLDAHDQRRIETNDPFGTGNPFQTSLSCSGKSPFVNWRGDVPCTVVIEGIDDSPSECNNVSGCVWRNATDLFGINIAPSICTGMINLTNYGIPANSTKAGICENAINYRTCVLFGCSWGNVSTVALENIDPTETRSIFATMWSVIKWTITLKLDIGLGTAGNWIYIFLGFYVELLALMIAIYYMLPFAH